MAVYDTFVESYLVEVDLLDIEPARPRRVHGWFMTGTPRRTEAINEASLDYVDENHVAHIAVYGRSTAFRTRGSWGSATQAAAVLG